MLGVIVYLVPIFKSSKHHHTAFAYRLNVKIYIEALIGFVEHYFRDD